MENITLNESDLAKIVNKVLNEQEIRQFNEDQIELLNFIFERELKPSFRKGKKDSYDDYPYYNRDGECIGWLRPKKDFTIRYKPCLINIEYKVCQVFKFSHDNWRWWGAIKPHLKSWIEYNLSIEINALDSTYM